MRAKGLRIVIPGGSGQVGTLLARYFLDGGHDVSVLSRYPKTAPWREVLWDGVAAGEWTSELDGSDVCINLAGRSVNCRYGAANRRAIYDSRIVPTRLLNEVIATIIEQSDCFQSPPQFDFHLLRPVQWIDCL